MAGSETATLRLAWDNPQPVERPAEVRRAALALLPPPTPRPRRAAATTPRVNLAVAIETHLAGLDGLTEQDFLVLFAHGR